jgi:multiple sugar transport system permease protein
VKALKIILAIIIALAFLSPLILMLQSSFLPDDMVIRKVTRLSDFIDVSFIVDNYFDIFERILMVRILINSVLFILPIITLGMIINAAAGYAFARLDFKGKDFIFLILASLIIIPFESLALPLFLLIGVRMNLMNTIPGLFLPYLVKAFNIYFFRQYFYSLPKDIEEAARIEGASWYRIFFSIALPLAKPALAAVLILDFTMYWSEYLWPLIITNKVDMETIQLGLAHFYTLPPIQWGDIMAYSVVATIPMFLIFIFFQKYLISAYFTSGIKQ